MCGRYVPPEQLDMERFWGLTKVQSLSSLVRRFNVAPTLQVPIIVRDADGSLALLDARWGLVPHWWKQDKAPPMTFNARSEEAAEKPMWRDALRSKRCLMPAYGWYEWNEKEKVTGPSGKPANQPYYHYSPNSEVIAIAGLWSVWNRPDANPMLSCALMTKDACESVANVHHRMPIILKPEQYDAWLDPKTSARDIQAIIADPRSDFEHYRVSVAVNNARNDYPELLDRLEAA
jgi:putative SOS response-associated peptidase YedK